MQKYEDDSDKDNFAHDNSRNFSQHHNFKNSSHYDNKSTTIIIHDKDTSTDNLHISVYK